MPNIRIALAGNPNCGKTTMFNALTGARQYVGNWPGVTVEKKGGDLKGHKDVTIEDLPGIYSLSPYTLEEVVSRNYLITEKPDVILNLVDASNLERNLYLTTQLLEIGAPTVLALNMMDLVEKAGDRIDTKKLSEALGCPVITTSALKGTGVQEAAEKAISLAGSGKQKIVHRFDDRVETALDGISDRISAKCNAQSLRWFAIKVFERDEKVVPQLNLSESDKKEIEAVIEQVETAFDDVSESIITNERYTYISQILKGCYKKAHRAMTPSDKIDQIVTNRVLALPIFAVAMFLVYWIAMGPFGSFLTDWTNDVLGGAWLTDGSRAILESWGCAEWLTGLISDGIFAGVGAVLGFVPQMLVLFLMLALLEDIGYMARVAFIMDRIFRKFGLSGKSFIPMLIGSGCGVPGVMASRTIENERDRRMTIMTTCFVPCGAKMPIIGMFAGALFGGSGLVAVSAYFIGVAAIIVSGIILKKTKGFAGTAAPFIMELPAYHVPAAGNVLRATWERGWSFIKRAGTVIVASTIILWFLQGFGVVDGSLQMVEDNNDSILAAIGGAICFIFAPLGFGDWQSTVATVSGLIAKENVVSTFGILFQVGEEVAEDDVNLWAAVGAHYTAITGFSYMVFNLLCAPCFAAMGAIKREMNNTKWTFAAIGYMCGFAYLISLMIYQFGGLITGEVSFGIGTIAAIIDLAFILYMLFRKNKYSEYDNEPAVLATAAANR